MSDVKRWTHHVTWVGDLRIQATMMALRSDGEYVLYSDYAALEAELAKMKAQQEQLVEALKALYTATTQAPFNHDACELAQAALAAAREGGK